jgi:hypothetical protein
MRFFFLDESGHPVMGQTQYFVLAGLILPADAWPTLRDRYDRLKIEYGLNPSIEIKWRHIRHPGGHRNPLRTLSDNERTQFARRALGIIRATTFARVLAIVVDNVAAYARPDISSAEDIYERAVTLAMERFQYYLRAAKDYGIVVQDQRHQAQDIRLRAFYRSLLTEGTRWTRFPNILESVFLTPSGFSTGLQFADIIAGSCYAAFCTQKRDPKYFNIIRGKITGDRRMGKRHGFKRWP